MAVKGSSAADRTTRWDVMVTNLTPSLPEMPNVVDDVTSLAGHLARARSLVTQQEDLRSQARKLSAELKLVLVEGDAVRSRLGATLKGKFGFTDATVVKYGYKPIPKSGRKHKSSPSSSPPPVEVKPAPASPEPPAVPVPSAK
jgi:hypothetical protein